MLPSGCQNGLPGFTFQDLPWIRYLNNHVPGDVIRANEGCQSERFKLSFAIVFFMIIALYCYCSRCLWIYYCMFVKRWFLMLSDIANQYGVFSPCDNSAQYIMLVAMWQVCRHFVHNDCAMWQVCRHLVHNDCAMWQDTWFIMIVLCDKCAVTWFIMIVLCDKCAVTWLIMIVLCDKCAVTWFIMIVLCDKCVITWFIICL